MLRVAFLGSGNVASHLAPALQKSGVEISAIWSRTAKRAESLAAELDCIGTDQFDLIPKSDYYILAVADDAVRKVAEALVTSHPSSKVAHTSGSVPLSIYDGLDLSGGVFYPLQTFSKQKPVDLRAVPFCIEANDGEVESELFTLAEKVSDHVQLISSQERAQIHLAAVFACNFSNHCYAIAESLLTEKGLSLDLLRPLIKETANKANQLPPRDAQTGPAIRGDEATMNKHQQALNHHPDWQKIYTLLSKSIVSPNDES